MATDSMYDYPDTLCAEPQNNVKTIHFPENKKSVKQVAQDVNSKIKLYPNPNNGSMLLDYELNKDEVGVLILFDITGKQLSRYKLKEENKTVEINEAILENGIYFYKVIVNDEIVKTDKLIIIK